MHLKISWPFTTPQVREDIMAEENKRQTEVAEQSKLPSCLLFLEGTRNKETDSFNFHKPSHLTHLQLKDPPLFLHLFCDLCAGDLCTDHAVLLGMFPLLLLDLCATKARNRR